MTTRTEPTTYDIETLRDVERLTGIPADALTKISAFETRRKMRAEAPIPTPAPVPIMPPTAVATPELSEPERGICKNLGISETAYLATKRGDIDQPKLSKDELQVCDLLQIDPVAYARTASCPKMSFEEWSLSPLEREVAQKLNIDPAKFLAAKQQAAK